MDDEKAEGYPHSNEILRKQQATTCMQCLKTARLYISCFLYAAGLLICANSHAQAKHHFSAHDNNKHFYLSFGSYIIFNSDISLSLTDNDIGAGVSIDPVSAFDLDMEKSVNRLNTSYHFNAAHAIDFSWYRLESTGNKTLEHDIEWVDREGNDMTIKAGAYLQTGISYDIYKVAYDWSFYTNDKVRLFTSIGLNVMTLDFDLNAQAAIGNEGRDEIKDVDTDIPLPAFGLGINYRLSPYFQWYLKSQVFALGIDDIKGSYNSVQFGGDFQIGKHFAIGTAIISDTINFVEDDNEKLSFSNKVDGINLYISTFF